MIFFLCFLLLIFFLEPIHSHYIENPNYKLVPSIFDRLNVSSKQFPFHFANIDFPYRIAHFPADTILCANAFVLVFIPTRPTAIDIRMAIRQSWARDRPRDVVVKFVIGLPKSIDLLPALLSEQKKFGDLIFYDVLDSYKNLLIKVHAAFYWQQSFCPKVKFILKTDDDSIVDLNRLDYWIKEEMAPQTRSNPKMIFGMLMVNNVVFRNPKHKWHVPHHLYSESVYPVYTKGASYMLTSEAITSILKHTKEVVAFPIEDAIYCGITAELAGVERRDMSNHFRMGDYIRKKEKCRNGVPMVTSLFGENGAYRMADYARKYNALKNIRCG